MANKLAKLTANGVLPLNLGWRGAYHRLQITGGPFDYFPAFEAEHLRAAFGVCVRAERAPPSLDLHLPIRDFDVPPPSMQDRVDSVLRGTLRAALDGKYVYVGCMGGWGRTGLVLAVLAKASGVDDPVGYVRQHYSPHAVETQEQQAYVSAFDATALRSWLFWAAWNKRLFGWLR